MTSILLAIIYLAFISLGLPDSILGSAWPSMYGQLNVSISYAGIISMIIAAGTIVSSLSSDKAIRKFGTPIVTIVSVGLTAFALMGFSMSTSFWQLCLFGIPYGLGAGSVDAALNNFVALHYKSRHMSWLHCFWGIGATLGPSIMGFCLTEGLGWNRGYQGIGLIQIGLVVLLLFTLPIWKIHKNAAQDNTSIQKGLSLKEALLLPGAKSILIAFFCYCSLEGTAGLWASSYLVLYKGLSPETAATWAALFYFGITFGRFICGFVTDYFGAKVMVRMGQVIACLGAALLLIPGNDYIALAGLIGLGIGCAPIYPCLLHQTPENFGADKSQAIMGMQMACAYVGSTLMPPLFGIIADKVSIMLYPIYLVIFVVLMFFMAERMNQVKKSRAKNI